MSESTNEKQSLTLWMRENIEKIPNNMIYKTQTIAQMCFFRDNIAALFITSAMLLDDIERLHFCKIHGLHMSKSIKLPVYCFDTPRISVVARNNFHNWNVSIQAKDDIVIPRYFNIDANFDCLFMEGMNDCNRNRHAEDKREFSFCVWDDYELYAIMRCIVSQVK